MDRIVDMAVCPQCQRSLAEIETPAGAALGCDGCAHVWIDAHSLEVLQMTSERRYTADDVRLLSEECKARRRSALERPVTYCKCPGCGKQMLRRTFGVRSFLLVNFCAADGYWIHRDELAGIHSYVTRGGELLEMKDLTENLEKRLRDLESDVRILKEKKRRGYDSGGFAFVPIVMP